MFLSAGLVLQPSQIRTQHNATKQKSVLRLTAEMLSSWHKHVPVFHLQRFQVNLQSTDGPICSVGWLLADLAGCNVMMLDESMDCDGI